MLIFKTTKGVADYLAGLRQNGKSIGFAPTMGALHEGHLSLFGKAVAENDICVSSIFVNPTQFTDKQDLERYPRTFEKDIEQLVAAGCDVLFYPDVKEIYPEGLDLSVNVDFGYLLQTMEAVFRKGHFEGVAQVVKRLLDIVQPHTLYMGQKDYQQLLVVKKMIQTLHIPTRLIMCPTVREADGLAMSSRNVLLTEKERAAAVSISKALFSAKEKIKTTALDVLVNDSISTLNRNPLLKTDYFQVADAETLQPATVYEKEHPLVICAAVKAGAVRLIDNILID